KTANKQYLTFVQVQRPHAAVRREPLAILRVQWGKHGVTYDRQLSLRLKDPSAVTALFVRWHTQIVKADHRQANLSRSKAAKSVNCHTNFTRSTAQGRFRLMELVKYVKSLIVGFWV
ncbi:hypothetical protein EVAR_64775_1, partial [Eumeta japonica]